MDSLDLVYLIFRDSERDRRVSIAVSDDPELWKRDGVLHLLVQRTEQGDGETLGDLGPQEVSALEWRP